MKAKLYFQMDDPDERKELMRSLKATDMAMALFDIQHNVYQEVEQSLDNTGEMSSLETVDLVFDKIGDIFIKNNINLEELID